jgi:hypothetical protein
LTKAFSTDIYGNTIIVRDVNVNKLKELDQNFQGIKYIENQEKPFIAPAVSAKSLKKKSKSLQKASAELSYAPNRSLVPHLAFYEPENYYNQRPESSALEEHPDNMM